MLHFAYRISFALKLEEEGLTAKLDGKMRAVVITHPGNPDVMRMEDVTQPVAQRGEVRVRVKATAVNRADLLQRMGKYPPPKDVPEKVPGLEFAGVVDQIGDGPCDWRVGDRVMGLVGGGAYSQYVVVHPRTLAPIPERFSFAAAASIPEVYITAYDALVSQMGLAPGDVVLINAVGSGVGTAALQIANAFGGRVIGTSRTREKLEKAKEYGDLEGVVVTDCKFAEDVLRLTGGRGVDIVLELNGGSYVSEDIACMANKGRLTVVGLVAGASSSVDLARVLSKRLEIRGTTLRMRPLEEKIEANNVFVRQVLPLFEKGLLKPVIDVTFPLERASDAHRFVEENKNFGKVVLTVCD